MRGHAQFRYVPPDLDDTSVASIALSVGTDTLVRNRALILANRASNGLFFSWISLRRRWVPNAAYWWISLTHLLRDAKKSIAFYHIAPSERHDIDAVVNSNVLMYLGRSPETEPVVDFLVDLLREKKEIRSDKWYDSPFVLYYFFSRALRRAEADAGPLLLARLRSQKPASPLETALAICARLDWGKLPGVAEVEALLDAQLDTGGWPLEPFYKGERTRWGSEELSTGFCLEALSRWLAGRPS